jgi:hypothetical protein
MYLYHNGSGMYALLQSLEFQFLVANFGCCFIKSMQPMISSKTLITQEFQMCLPAFTERALNVASISW